MVSLKDKEKLVRCNAALALGGLGDRTATDTLIIALRDQDTEVHEAVEKALTKLISPEELKKRLSEAEVDRHIATLQQRIEPEARISAAEALGELINTRAVKTLIVALNKFGNQAVREAAARALGKIADPRAVEPLIRALKWRNLEGITEERIDGATDQRYTVVIEEYETGWRLRVEAANALGNIGNLQAIEPLISAIQDEHPSVREAAANALGMLGDKRAIEPLKSLLCDKYDSVQRKAVAALKKLA